MIKKKCNLILIGIHDLIVYVFFADIHRKFRHSLLCAYWFYGGQGLYHRCFGPARSNEFIGILILKPGGIIETREIGEFNWWATGIGKESD